MQFAPLYPILYRGLKPLFPQCLWSGNDHARLVALTFDDGPHPHYTPQLLDILKQYNVTASFFWLGICVDRCPEIARAVYEHGHWLGLHGYTHQAFPTLSPAALQQTLVRSQAAIANACKLPAKAIRDVRPPNGLFTPRTLDLLVQWDYRPVMWSVVPEDWVRPGISKVVRRVIQQTRNGSVIVLHDGNYGGDDVAETTRHLIPWLLENNYRFATVDHLWQSRLKE
jgi:peptidoglycan/xylan/chitin deacetylase (PgdA/CDA1 family)